MATDWQRQRSKRAALRLVLEHQNGEARLVDIQKVEMTVPLSDEVEGSRAGFWYELVDSGGRPLYRRVIANPMTKSPEVRRDTPEEGLTHVEASEVRGTFVLVAPDLPELSNLVLYASPEGPGVSLEPAKPIARFDLKRAE